MRILLNFILCNVKILIPIFWIFPIQIEDSVPRVLSISTLIGIYTQGLLYLINFIKYVCLLHPKFKLKYNNYIVKPPSKTEIIITILIQILLYYSKICCYTLGLFILGFVDINQGNLNDVNRIIYLYAINDFTGMNIKIGV